MALPALEDPEMTEVVMALVSDVMAYLLGGTIFSRHTGHSKSLLKKNIKYCYHEIISLHIQIHGPAPCAFLLLQQVQLCDAGESCHEHLDQYHFIGKLNQAIPGQCS